MLDAHTFRLYFKTDVIFAFFEKVDPIPNVEDLERIALNLHRAYSIDEAVHRASSGEPHPCVQRGIAWDVRTSLPWNQQTCTLLT